MRKINFRFSPHSLQWKFFFIALCIALSVMVLSLSLCYQIAVRTIEGMAANFLNEYIQYADSNMNGMISNARAVSLAISMDKETALDTLTDTAAEASYPWFVQTKRMEGYLSGMITDKAYIERAVVAVSDGRIYQSGNPLIRRRTVEEPWFVTTAEKQSMQLLYEMGETPRVLLTRPVLDYRSAQAVVLLELSHAALVSVYSIDPLRAADVLVYTPAGELFFSNGVREDGDAYGDLAAWPATPEDTLTTYYEILEGVRCFVVQYRSSVTGLSTVAIISEKDLIHDAMHMSGQIVGITAASLLLAAMASIALSFLLFKNLNRFMRTMKAVRGGRLDVRSPIRSGDEIGEMSVTFNTMMDRIESLMEQVKQEEAKKREAEQNVLLAQIQPHFIYNAISAMQYVASMRGEKDIEKVAVSLSHLLRSVLGNQDAFITLWEERAFIGSYMDIQRFKHQGDFALQWDVEEALWSMPIPKLLLQPIVENALLHGIAGKGSGTITVKAYGIGAEVVIKVIDDGVGIAPRVIETLNVDGGIPGDMPSTFRKVGLANVFSRLHMIYGPGAHHQVFSEPGTFTCIELRFPYRQEVR